MKSFVLSICLLFLSHAAIAAVDITQPPYNVVCDGSDQRMQVQAAIDAASPGTILLAPCGHPIGLGVNPNSNGQYSLLVTKPVLFKCEGGTSFYPLLSGSPNANIFYFEGTTLSYPVPTGFDGCFIGNVGARTRTGLHAIVIDTQVPQANPANPNTYIWLTVSNHSFIQESSTNGYGIFAVNSSNNSEGGLKDVRLCDNSIVRGGISLNLSGDSISLRDCTIVGPNNIFVNLISNGGNAPAGNFIIDGGGLSTAGGIQINCVESAQIINVEMEQNMPFPTGSTGFLKIGGSDPSCTKNVTVSAGQIQSDPLTPSLPSLINIGNATHTVIDNLQILCPPSSSTKGITIASGANNTLIGAGNYLPSGTCSTFVQNNSSSSKLTSSANIP